jgi:anti-anti-sigma factor
MTDEGDVTITREDGVAVASLRGEIDIVNAADVAERLEAGIDDASSVIVDLRSVLFMDSQAIALLDRLSDRVESNGRGFAVVAPPSSVPRRVLEIVDLGIPLYDDADAARTALSARTTGSSNGLPGVTAEPSPTADAPGQG